MIANARATAVQDLQGRRLVGVARQAADLGPGSAGRRARKRTFHSSGVSVAAVLHAARGSRPSRPPWPGREHSEQAARSSMRRAPSISRFVQPISGLTAVCGRAVPLVEGERSRRAQPRVVEDHLRHLDLQERGQLRFRRICRPTRGSWPSRRAPSACRSRASVHARLPHPAVPHQQLAQAQVVAGGGGGRRAPCRK
mgnify:CR=1 FL=1